MKTLNKPLREHFEVETDAGTTLRTFDYIEALEQYINSNSELIHPVKSLQECKDEVANKHGLDNYLDANVYNRANELADEVAELYAAQFKTPPVQEWISADARIPEESGRYWCYVKEINDLGVSHFQWNCAFDAITKLFTDNLKTMIVTHWMPLPESPRP